jgi:hypothetical protein
VGLLGDDVDGEGLESVLCGDGWSSDSGLACVGEGPVLVCGGMGMIGCCVLVVPLVDVEAI